LGWLVELHEERGDGAAAVVEGETIGGGKLGHGAAEGGKEEEGVVAEAAGAARGGEDEAFDRSLGGVEDFAIAGEGERAAVTGLAAGFGDGGEGGEEGGVVAVVGRVGVAGDGEIGGVAGAAAFAGGLQSLSAARPRAWRAHAHVTSPAPPTRSRTPSGHNARPAGPRLHR